MDLKDVPTAKLLEEMQKRKKEVDRPKIKPDVYDEFMSLIDVCEGYFDDIVKQGYSKNADHYIYEAAMECVYGKQCWLWINEHDKGC